MIDENENISEYIEGVIFYRFNGWFVPEYVVDKGLDAIHEYQKTHEKYPHFS